MDCGHVRIGQRIVYEDYREFLDYLLDEEVGVRLGNLRVVVVAKLVECILHHLGPQHSPAQTYGYSNISGCVCVIWYD